MSDPYVDFERNRWADPAKNRYDLSFNAVRNTVGADPVTFNAIEYRDADYASALAICGVMGRVQTAYARAMADFVGLDPAEQSPERLAAMIIDGMQGPIA